jgi:Pro-kumamolisin, activation domain
MAYTATEQKRPQSALSGAPPIFSDEGFTTAPVQFQRMAMSDSHRMPRSVVSCLTAFVVFGLVALTILPALAQTQADVIPNRIAELINPRVHVTLQNNVHPLAQAKYDQGAAPGSTETGRIMLILQRSDVQENALKQYLADLQNPNSPNYRKWLTPEQFGTPYGISDTDLATVRAMSRLDRAGFLHVYYLVYRFGHNSLPIEVSKSISLRELRLHVVYRGIDKVVWLPRHLRQPPLYPRTPTKFGYSSSKWDRA